MISYFTSIFYPTPTAPVEANNPSGPEDPMTTLLPELAKTIFSQFDMPLLGKLATISKKWNELSSSDDVWKKFENEFEIKAPEIKIKDIPCIKEEVKISMTTLKRVNEAIKKLIPDNKDFHCQLAKVLFDGNIHSIKVSRYYSHCIFEINLYKNREICFNDPMIFNLKTVKKAHLKVASALHTGENAGFVFNHFRDEKNIIKVNCNNSYFFCTKVRRNFCRIQ